jgi:GntR family transcriptional regulator, transcriptional repressor for pyruvate dehydrogenase complex
MAAPSTRPAAAARRPRSLATALVDAFGARIRAGRLRAGARLPTEAELMTQFDVSRTVVREALSKLQAAGLVVTRHGVGSFVAAPGEARTFSIPPGQMATLGDVIAVLELRIALEAEAAALAAGRRSSANLRIMRQALVAFAQAAADGTDAVGADLQLHMEVARATQNAHFVDLMTCLGTMLIPRTRVNAARLAGENRRDYLRRVHTEHQSIVDAIANRDPEAARAAMRTHLANSRERLRRALQAARRSPVRSLV